MNSPQISSSAFEQPAPSTDDGGEEGGGMRGGALSISGRWRPRQNLGRGQPLSMGSMAGEISRMKPAADKEEIRCRTKIMVAEDEKRERHPDLLAGELSGERIHLLLCCCCCCAVARCLALFLHAGLCRKIFCATCTASAVGQTCASTSKPSTK